MPIACQIVNAAYVHVLSIYDVCLKNKLGQTYRCDDTFFFSMRFSHPQTKQNAGIIVAINRD